MKTYQLEKQEHEKEIAALERKELKIGINYKYCRTQGDKACGKVTAYDDAFVTFQDANGLHFIPRQKFCTDYFKRGDK